MMWLRELHVSRAGFSSRAKNSDTVDATETVNPITVDDSEDNHVLNSSENACDCGFNSSGGTMIHRLYTGYLSRWRF
jgi:hypothetical protein